MHHSRLRSLEEDLADFEAGKLKDAGVTIVRADRNGEDLKPQSGTVEPIQQQQQQAEKVKKHVRFSLEDDDDADQVLKDIQEQEETRRMFLPAKVRHNKGFPKPFNANASEIKRKKKGVSLFKQRMMQMRGESIDDLPDKKPVAKEETSSSSSVKRNTASLPSVTTSNDIDAENRKRIEGMSDAEIAMAQSEIMQAFDSKLLEKLVAKRKTGSKKSEEKPQDKKPEEQSEKLRDLSWIRSEAQLQEAISLLPEEEQAKLAWTGKVPGFEDTEVENEQDVGGYRLSSEAVRFDLNGEVVRNDQEIDVTQGLHHHGLEPEKAGYTVEELIHLSRSTHAAQRSLALSCLGKILRNRHICIYGRGTKYEAIRKRVAEKNGLHALFSLPRSTLEVLRMGLDSENASVTTEAVIAMESFVVPIIFYEDLFDRNVLSYDAFLPAHVPLAQGVPDVHGPGLDEKALSEALTNREEDLIEASPVLWLLTTGVVRRLSIILGCRKNMETGVRLGAHALRCCLKILIHIAAHSEHGALHIMNEPHMLEYFIDQVVTPQDIDVKQQCLQVLTILTFTRIDFAKKVAQTSDGALLHGISETRDHSEMVWAMVRAWKSYGLIPSMFHPGKLVQGDESDLLTALTYLPGNQIDFEKYLSIVPIHTTRTTKTSKAELVFLDLFLRNKYRSERVLEEDLSNLAGPGHQGNNTTLDMTLKNIMEKVLSLIIQSEQHDLIMLNVLFDVLLDLANIEQARMALMAQREELTTRITKDTSFWPKLPVGSMSERWSHRTRMFKKRLVSGRIKACRMMIRIFGTDPSLPLKQKQSERRKQLCSLIPSRPQDGGDEWTAFQIIGALFSPKLGLVDLTNREWILQLYQDMLGGPARIEQNRKRKDIDGSVVTLRDKPRFTVANEDDQGEEAKGKREGEEKKRQRKLFESWAQKWKDAGSAWPMLPIFATFESKPLHVVLDATSTLVENDGAMKPENVILTLIRYFLEMDDPILFDPAINTKLDGILNTCLKLLFTPDENGNINYMERLRKAAGGQTRLYQLYEQLVVTYNDRLDGHSTATGCLLIMFRGDSDADIRYRVWTDLFGGNLLRLIVPNKKTMSDTLCDTKQYIQPVEKDSKILECMARSLCQNVVTRRLNPFLYEIILTILGEYLFEKDSEYTWTRRRILMELVLDGPYREVIQLDEEAGNRFLEVLSKQEQEVWKKLKTDGYTL